MGRRAGVVRTINRRPPGDSNAGPRGFLRLTGFSFDGGRRARLDSPQWMYYVCVRNPAAGPG